MQELLPLSWAKTRTETPVYRSLSLPLSGTAWVTFADLPDQYSLSAVKDDLEMLFPQGYLIRGCGPEAVSALELQGGVILRTGGEAVLHLQNGHFEKRSLRKLLHQAETNGKIVEMPLNDENRARLRELQRHARHGKRPQLSHVFRTYPFDACRCFVLLSPADEWLAAVTLTMRDDGIAHTELMLKHTYAQSGSMELLLAGVFSRLREEGFVEWSLSEVPFYHLGRETAVTAEERMMAVVAGLFRGAYDFKGLYDFKNKFSPEWRDVFLYSRREISPLILAELAVKTRFTALMAHMIQRTLMKPFS
ncbi:MAG: DUF2156 domain-containing protein [Chlorobium sp.]|nr:DUF2156 domain-containing protein [Chlorobium sp.]MCW8814475.1 DUF2156 domain-containing protein [Chlorobium sp.]MCW8819296.1 DUF2156 domain-containing protein [Ignavibacteriaceae bacterium]